MMQPIRTPIPLPRKSWIGLAAFALLGAPTAGALELADKPLFLPAPVEPNVVLTLDDSGSMKSAYAIPSPTGSSFLGGWRYDKSAHYNPYYYNPKLTYLPAKNAKGEQLSPCADPSSVEACFKSAYLNGFAPENGAVDLSRHYRPTWEYDPSVKLPADWGENNIKCNGSGGYVPASHFHEVGSNNPDFPGITAVACTAAYYYVFDPNNPNCDGSKTDEDCYDKVVVSDTSGPGNSDERKNFATWYAFYRTRNLMTVTAASRAFSGMGGKFRLAWQSINSCKSFDDGCKGWDAQPKDNRLRRFADGHRTDFYTWLFYLPAKGDTPLRSAMVRAGNYFSQPAAYRDDTLAGADEDNPARACRDNFHILMTDGEWNEDNDLDAYGNKDNTAAVLPDGKAYVAQTPYKDGNSNSLADIAFHYWATDLSGLENTVIPYTPDKADTGYWNPKNDPATWQHMVNFTVGLGLQATMGSDWAGDTYSGAYESFRQGTKTWPATGQGQPGNVYDLWHAALNSRGQFFSADQAANLEQAFARILARIEEQTGSAAALTSNAGSLDTGTVLYQASFESRTWSGSLTAIQYQIVNGVLTHSAAWPVDGKASFPAPGERAIYTWRNGAGTSFGGADIANAVGGEDVLAYLRGERGKEGSGEGEFRVRAGVLGDIIHSDPVYVGAANYGYSRLPEGLDTLGSKSYGEFVKANQKRVKMLYVGANDGMLHGFVAAAGEGAGNGCGGTLGRELFAYVPAEVIPNLKHLTEQNYTHRYYVDGPSYVGDAHLDDQNDATNDWRTLLLGTTGAGGRAVFALDVTNPCSFAADKVLWEFTHGDLGYTIGRPVIARLNNGKWAAVFGNGYNSAKQVDGKVHAALFIVDLKSGALIKKIDVGGTDNGLGSPALYDANGDMIADYVYAGDNEGGLWKFDLSDKDPAKWGVAYKDGADQPAPLFRAVDAAGQAQPITAPLELGGPPPGRQGVMVYFGTGRFFAENDDKDKHVQSFYGILDEGSTTDRSKLQEQKILFQNQTQRSTENNTLDADERGWYMDLVYQGEKKGERVISAPLLRHGRVIFTTLIPSDDPCKFGGGSWTMEVVAYGGGAEEAVFDVNGDGVWDVVTFTIDGKQYNGQPVSGINLGTNAAQPVVATGAGTERKFESTPKGTQIVDFSEKPGSSLTGRVSWREIID